MENGKRWGEQKEKKKWKAKLAEVLRQNKWKMFRCKAVTLAVAQWTTITRGKAKNKKMTFDSIC